MRVDIERSRNGYRSQRGRKLYNERFKRRNYRKDDYHIRTNGNLPSHILEKPHRYPKEDYSPSNRTSNDPLNYPSTRLDRHKTNHDIYTPLLNNLSGGLSPTALYYNSSSTRDHNSFSHYTNSERNRYHPSSLSSSATYRRDISPLPSTSSSYRDEYIPRSNHNDSYIHKEYHSQTPVTLRSNTDTYNDTYQTNDYNSRSERYDITPKRNCSSRDYAIVSVPSSVYHPDSYRTSSSIPLSSSSSSSLPLTSSSSSSLYSATREQYIQAFPSVREIDYRSRTYEMGKSMDQRYISSNKPSDHYYDDEQEDQYRSSSYSNHSNFKRPRTHFNDNACKRSMRRWEK
ncbi:hypothetical protein I4U23_012984 [Adineta vaga]|nr:hypothetical protein I4U23_012984 [Adineta vaga]